MATYMYQPYQPALAVVMPPAAVVAGAAGVETRAKKQHFKQHVRPWLGSASRSSTRSNPSEIGIAGCKPSPLMDVVATRPMFKAELEFTGGLTAVVALTAAQLASDDLTVDSAAGPSLRQTSHMANLKSIDDDRPRRT